MDAAKNTLYIFDDHSNDQSTDIMIYDQVVVMVLMMIVLLVIIALNKML